MASCCMPGRSSMALFTRTAKFDPGVHGARCAWAMAVHHAVGISRQRNSGYRPNRINIMAQGLSTPDPSLSPTHLSIRTGRTTTTHYTHHQVSLMASHNTTLVPSWSCTLGQPVRQASALACEGSVCHPKKERKKAIMRLTWPTERYRTKTLLISPKLITYFFSSRFS